MSVSLGRLAALASGLVIAACGRPGVDRVLDGREVRGRFVSDHAYAFYGAGAAAEAHGDWDRALSSYRAAAEEDDSAEVWTRIGAVLCNRSKAAADAAFERAGARDDEYEPLWRERARCALRFGDLPAASAASSRAIELDPDRDETVVLHAVVAERVGRAEDALHLLEGLVAQRPSSVLAWRALNALARRRGEAALGRWAARHLRELAPSEGPALEDDEASLAPLAEIDAALARDDLSAARRRARLAHIPGAELAARAAALGRTAVARDQAELVLGADPSDATARVALAVAADLARDDPTMVHAVAGLTAGDAAPSPLARLLFAELLERRVSEQAASAWLGPPPPGVSGDPLLGRARIRALGLRERSLTR